MVTKEMIDGYLKRIEVKEAPPVTPEGLKLLQISHLKHIPFENLDIIAGKIPLKLDIDSVYKKLVEKKRGGICYEQNTLFSNMLEALGFNVRRMASHRLGEGKDEFDHMFLMVDFDSSVQSTQTWISDVGYGFNNLAPIKFETDIWQSDTRDMLQVEDRKDGTYYLNRRDPSGAQEIMYTFNLVSHTIDEYRPRCDYFSTAEDSFFTQGPMTSLDELGGRKLLTKDHFRKYDANRVETVIDVLDQSTYDRILKEEFGIVIDGFVVFDD